MTEIQVDLEVQRLRNVAEAMGWMMTKQEMVEDKVVITLAQAVVLPEVELDKGAS